MRHCSGRRHRLVTGALLALGILLGGSLVRAAELNGPLPQVVRVTKTFDGKPFGYRILSREEKPGYTVYRLTYPSPMVTAVSQNNTIPAEYYVPAGMKPDDPKRPAMICLHPIDGSLGLIRMTCSAAALRGMPAIGFMLPYYGERALPEGPLAMAADPKLFLGAVDQAMIDIKRTVDVLLSRSEVDSKHISVMGMSLGSIIGATAAAIDPRIDRAVLIMGGGDVSTIVHFAQETRPLSNMIKALPAQEQAKVESVMKSLDPLTVAGQLRERAMEGKVLMINASEDEVIPPACSRKLAAALGIEDRVVWLTGMGHYSAFVALPRIRQMTMDFLAQDLPAGLKLAPVVTEKHTPLQTVLGIVQQTAGFAAARIDDGRCHTADLEVTVTAKGSTAYSGSLFVARGANGRFKLQCKLPMLGELAIGQCEYPWIVSNDKTLFKGTGGDGQKPDNPLKYADPASVERVQSLSAAVAGLSLAPDMLDQLLSVKAETTADNRETILVGLKKGGNDSLRLSLADDRQTPDRISFDIRGVQGTITVRNWQHDTRDHRKLFEPPAGLATKEVDREALYRIYAAIFNFAMETMR